MNKKAYFNHSKEGEEIPKEYLDQMVLTESNYKTAILSQNNRRESKLMKEISNKNNLQVLHEDTLL
jgi:hypothetical protein